MFGLIIGIFAGGIIGFMGCAIITSGNEDRHSDTGKEKENGAERVPSAHQED